MVTRKRRSIMKVTPSGRTYRFKKRPGFRKVNGVIYGFITFYPDETHAQIGKWDYISKGHKAIIRKDNRTGKYGLYVRYKDHKEYIV